jgi:hypothetical protein
MAEEKPRADFKAKHPPARLSYDSEAPMDEDKGAEGIALLDVDLPEGCEFVPPRGRLGSSELDWIGRELREYYDGILREPVPDRLLALVDQSLARRTFH